MADKEATVYIVDVGKSMGGKRHGRAVSDLDWAMTYVWDKITSTVALERKTATLGVIGLRTTGTANELSSDPSFENISVFQEISQILLPDLKALRQKVELSVTDNGDAISAIVIAIQMISKYCKRLKYQRRIVLVTDGKGLIDADGKAEISKKIKAEGIELIVVGVDFDDPDYGYKEENKEFEKAANEKTLRELVDDCEGIFGTLQQAVEELGIPRLKATRPVSSYKGYLTLGNPELYPETACRIDVDRYPRTMIRRPPSASKFVQRSETSKEQDSNQSSNTLLPETGDPNSALAENELTSVKNSRTYQVIDEGAPGGKKDVDRDELARGYEYGRTAVHISESDENVTKLETQAGLEIIGFIPWASYDRFMSMSVSSIIIAQKTNNKAIMALSSLIWALSELESYAIARLVPKADKPPVLLIVAPSIENDYECLLDVQLPFVEDVRSYKFPPLDKVVTVSGKIITAHRNLPTEKLSSAISDYVDSMDLSTFGKDDEGNPAEYMTLNETFSPVLHRIDQAIRWRAVHPNEPIPPPYEILTRYSQPPELLIEGAKPHLERSIATANVKKVPPKVQSRKRIRNDIKPLSGLDVDALLAKRPKTSKISPTNPIPEFRQLLDTTESAAGIQDAATQLGSIIELQITDSFGDLNYARVIEEMGVMRSELIELEEVGIYNDWVTKLREKVLGGVLGGDRKELWREIAKNRVGLVEKKEAEIGGVGEEEARKNFLAIRNKDLKDAQFIPGIPVVGDLHPRNAANEWCALIGGAFPAIVENVLDGNLLTEIGLGTRIAAGTRDLVFESSRNNGFELLTFGSGNAEAIKDSKSVAILLAIVISCFRL